VQVYKEMLPAWRMAIMRPQSFARFGVLTSAIGLDGALLRQRAQSFIWSARTFCADHGAAT
jgi:hypothetical protein